MPLMRGVRARWKIESEPFNTSQNQGYCFGLQHLLASGLDRLSLKQVFEGNRVAEPSFIAVGGEGRPWPSGLCRCVDRRPAPRSRPRRELLWPSRFT